MNNTKRFKITFALKGGMRCNSKIVLETGKQKAIKAFKRDNPKTERISIEPLD